MSKKAKLFIAIGSRLGSLTEATGVGGYTSYRISKAGLNMACVCMAHDPSMMGIGIKFLVLHPGWVNTDMVCSYSFKSNLARGLPVVDNVLKLLKKAALEWLMLCYVP